MNNLIRDLIPEDFDSPAVGPFSIEEVALLLILMKTDENVKHHHYVKIEQYLLKSTSRWSNNIKFIANTINNCSVHYESRLDLIIDIIWLKNYYEMSHSNPFNSIGYTLNFDFIFNTIRKNKLINKTFGSTYNHEIKTHVKKQIQWKEYEVKSLNCVRCEKQLNVNNEHPIVINKLTVVNNSFYCDDCLI